MFHIISQGRQTGKTHKASKMALDFLLEGKNITFITFNDEHQIQNIVDIIKTDINFTNKIGIINYYKEKYIHYKNKTLKITFFNNLKTLDLFNDIIIVDELLLLNHNQIKKLNDTRKEIYCFTSGIFKTEFNRTCFNIISKMRFHELDCKKTEEYKQAYKLLVSYFGKDKVNEEIVKYQTSVFSLMDSFEIKENCKPNIELLIKIYNIGLPITNELIGNIFEDKLLYLKYKEFLENKTEISNYKSD